MRGATRCAQRLKVLFSSLRKKLGKVSRPSSGEPVTQMILGILSRDVPESKAREALDRIRSLVVDFNELRVIPPIELAETLGDHPDVRLKCEDISRSLNGIFALNHLVSLDHLAEMPRKELRAWLDRIEGLDAYTRARVQLLGLRRHAIPLDEAMWAYARDQQIVDQRCPLEEAQAFLERQIAEEDALEFVALLRRQAWVEMGGAVRAREVARIASIPPDRTTRNMLQLVESDNPDEPSAETAPTPAEPSEEPPAKKTSREARAGKADKKSRATKGATRTTARKGGKRTQAGAKPKRAKPKRAKAKRAKARKAKQAKKKPGKAKRAARRQPAKSRRRATKKKAGTGKPARSSAGRRPKSKSA